MIKEAKRKWFSSHGFGAFRKRREGWRSTGTGFIVAAAFLGTCGSAAAQLISPAGLNFLQSAKQFIYNGVTTVNADGVAAGTADAFVYEEMTPGSLPAAFYHYPVKDSELAAFTTALQLPSFLKLVPISIVKGTPPRHSITVSVFETGGERSGLRAEWTTYVQGPGDDRTRTLMLESITSKASVNPVVLNAPAADKFVYQRNVGGLVTEVISGSSSFSAAVQIPDRPVRAKILDRHWGAAGDVIYWRNGVADLQNFNGLIANRRVTVVPSSAVTVSDGSPWAAFTDENPEWVLLFDQRIDVALRPWVNADDPGVPLDPAFRQQLLATKATVFSELEYKRAAAVTQNQAEPMADFLLEAHPPAIFLNFRIPADRRSALEAAIPLPPGFHLAPIQPHAGVARDYYMSLNIYLAAGLAPGYRAEWSVYAQKEGDTHPRFMIIDARTSTLSIDPITFITVPTKIFKYVAGPYALGVDIRARDMTFQAFIPVPPKPVHTGLNLDWAECNNLVYWRNGVADKIYYNESAYGDVAILPTQNAVIQDGTRWARFIELDHIFIYPDRQTFVASPWNNLNALQAAAPPAAKPAPAKPAPIKKRPVGARR